jgi:hypothetical protein
MGELKIVDEGFESYVPVVHGRQASPAPGLEDPHAPQTSARNEMFSLDLSGPRLRLSLVMSRMMILAALLLDQSGLECVCEADKVEALVEALRVLFEADVRAHEPVMTPASDETWRAEAALRARGAASMSSASMRSPRGPGWPSATRGGYAFQRK